MPDFSKCALLMFCSYFLMHLLVNAVPKLFVFVDWISAEDRKLFYPDLVQLKFHI